ncbi:hypothetical protein KAR91_58460 [Candidatus Pacearchaeota archaeon]|nr:hypothetical protein [Candidatus Pacearchaeota archaeon]
MALSNPFDRILEPGREAPPSEALTAFEESGIPADLPEDINPFDAIGYEAPPEPVYQRVGDYMGAEILQDEGGKWYSSTPAMGVVELPEDVKAQVGAEIGGLEEPWIDPTTVGFAAGGVGAKFALKAGAKALGALGRGAVTGTIAAAAEYPIGAATELIEEKHPGLALPFNLAVGVISGITIESAIEKAVAKGLARGASKGVIKAKTVIVKEALKSGDMSDPITRNVADEINERLKVNAPVKSAEEAAEALKTVPKAEYVNPFDEAVSKFPEEITRASQIKEVVPGAYSIRDDITQRFPDLEAEEFDYIAREIAQDLDDMGLAKAGREGQSLRRASSEWNRFVDEGWERATKGKKKGQVLASLETFKPMFEEKAAAYLDWKGGPEAGGLAYGQKLPKYAASVNLERVGADYSTKKMILDTADRYKGLIDEVSRGKITHETTRQMADDLGMTEKQLLKRRKGRAFNAEEALAARDILNTSAGNLVKLQQKIVADPTEENLALFKMAMERHAAVQAEVSGVATEAGRALSAHRIQSAKNARVAKNYDKMLEALGGREKSDKIAQYFGTIDPTDQQAVNKFVMEMTKAKTSEQLFEAWVNGLLSGPQTHVVNTTSNALTFLSNIPERATGATLDLLRAGITRSPRERFFGELPQHIYGGWHGMKEGITAGLKAFATEIPTEDAMKLEIPRKMAIKGKKGRIIRLPGRALMAMDEFFKSINYRAELHSLAFRKAAKEGKKGQARADRIAEILMEPTEELKGKATKEMLYRVFQAELGPTGKALTKLRTDTPGLKYIIPFLKTPTNIAKFGIERTPLSVFRYPKMFKQLMKGEIDASQITDEMAKTLMGSMIGLGTFMYAKEGSITGGGPKNKAEREALYRTGWQPYSLKVGDKHYSYGRLEPMGMIMGTAADAAEIWDEMGSEEQENVAALISLSVAKNLTSKTFMKGLSDALNATTDPTRYGAYWVQNFAGTAIPSIVAGTARAADPELKEVQSIIDKWKSRLPGISRGLLPKRDIWGSPIKRDVTGPTAMVTPVYISAEKGTKADQEIARLGVRISKPSKKVMGKELTKEEYDKLVIAGGQEAKKRIDRFVAGTSYDKISDEMKGKMIKKLYDGAIRTERVKTFSEMRSQAK